MGAASCLGASVGGFLCIGGATLVLVASFTGAGAGSIAVASSSALVRSAFAVYMHRMKKRIKLMKKPMQQIRIFRNNTH